MILQHFGEGSGHKKGDLTQYKNKVLYSKDDTKINVFPFSTDLIFSPFPHSL